MKLIKKMINVIIALIFDLINIFFFFIRYSKRIADIKECREHVLVNG